MITVETGDFNSAGIADLEEAVTLAREQGIANARNAIAPDALWGLFSLGSMAALGMAQEIPGVGEGSCKSGVSVLTLDVSKTPTLLGNMLRATQDEIVRVTGSSLPGWRPTTSKTGARMIIMQGITTFNTHTDDYEGLVASAQIMVDGEKVMKAKVNGESESVPIKQGDITLFAGDTFSEQSRICHGFSLDGNAAVAATLGQDIYYTISGKHPILDDKERVRYMQGLRG
jgi:hypothetical protein